MTESPKIPKRSAELRHLTLIIAVGWTAAIGLGAGLYLFEEYKHTVETARIQALGSFEKDLIYRRWAAGHGGVYVPVTETSPPNPYLSHIENRDVTTTSGLSLTLVNPAYMTRQVHELGREQYGHQGHITSLNPLRPENAADPWEKEALRAFELGETEVAELAMIEGQEYMRLMRPLLTEARCLKCHAAQGYEEGDVRGGISVSVPMAPLWKIGHAGMTAVSTGYGVVWLLGLGGISLGASRLNRRMRERDRAEEALRRHEHMVSSTTDMLALVDHRYIYLAANPAYLAAFVNASGQVVGKTVSEVFGQEMFNKVIRPLADRCLAGENIRYQEWFDFPAVGRKYMDVAYSPYRTADTEVRGFVVTARDVTERKQAEDELKKRREEQETIFDSVPAAIYYKDRENRLVRVNQALADSAGMTKAEMEDKSLFDLYPDLAKDYWRDDREVMASRQPKREIIEQLQTPDGTRWLTTDKIPYEDENGDIVGVIGFSLDITERKRLEEELEQRTHDLAERLKELNCLYVISKLAEGPDVTMEQVLQGTVDIIPSSWQYPEITKARITVEDRVYATPDFRESNWRQTANIVVNGETVGNVEVCYLEEKPASDEGPFLKEERNLINAIAEQLGKITQRHRLEDDRALLKEQLHQAQKLEAVAQLASGVAHDFNNLLTVINGYVDVAKNALPEGHKAIESLSCVQEASDQAAGVTRSLLTFSHKMQAKKEAVELHATVEKSLRLLRHVLPSGIEVKTKTPLEPVWVNADGIQLQQIIMNLAINARDAMPDGGTLDILVSKSMPQEGGLGLLGDPQCRIARLVIIDSGTGMDPDVLERIFEPFFTTKPRELGTGLGLAIIHSIVDDHAGHIRVESKPGRGTTFTVELPLFEFDKSQGAEVKEISPKPGRGEVVLLAEDNRHVRSILASALESLDYKVVQANDGASLMDCFENHRERVELLVIDVDLPKRNGLECLRDIRSSGADAPAIIITGSVGEDLEKRLDKDTILLRKPFQIAVFSELVGNLLSSRCQREGQR